MIFKFALDVQITRNNKWVYGGDSKNDGFASKSAGQELLSSDFLGLLIFIIFVFIIIVHEFFLLLLLVIVILLHRFVFTW
jgi:hypothetical protein